MKDKAKEMAKDTKNAGLLLACIDLVTAMDKQADASLPQEIANVVKLHTKGATATALGVAWIPGAGGKIALAANAAVIWTMYLRINHLLGIKISKNIAKTVAAGVASNLAINAVVVVAVTTVVSLFPGVGSLGASATMGVATYGMVIAAGHIYIKILTRIFKAGKDPNTLSGDELNNLSKEVMENENVKSLMKEAKKEYTRAKSSGELEEWKNIKVDLEDWQ